MRLRPRDIQGSVVVITGASSGVGRASALAFAEHHARLVLSARGAESLDDVAEECRARGAEAIVVPADVADAAAVERIRLRSLEHFGVIDVWVEGAAVLVAAPFGEETVEEVRRLVDTNVLGTFLGARAAVRTFEAQGHGVLINISSMLGLVPNPVVPAYVMSKFAVRGLSLALRQAMSSQRDVHICVVLPGPVDTPIFDSAANRTGRRLRAIPPAVAPERAAAVIVSCARHPRRQAAVGMTARAILVGHRLAPRLAEWGVAEFSGRALTRSEPAPVDEGSLFRPGPVGRVHGGWRRGRRRRRLGEAYGRWLSRRGAPEPVGDHVGRRADQRGSAT